MFYTEEDIQPAIELVISLFGNSNKYEHDNRNAYKNVSIMTRNFGKLWFGDLELTDSTKGNMENLSVTLNQKIYLVRDYDFDNALYVTTSKLREVNNFEENSYL